MLFPVIHCFRRLIVVQILLCILLPLVGIAQSTDEIVVRGKAVKITNNASAWFRSQKAGSKQVLIHFTTIPGVDSRNYLAANGIFLQDYIAGATFIAVITEKSLGFVPSFHVWGITDINPVWKMDENVRTLSIAMKTNVRLIVSLYDVLKKDSVQSVFEKYGVTSEKSELNNIGTYIVSLPASNVKQFAAHYAVRALSLYSENIPLNYESKAASKTSTATIPLANGGRGLSGEGITVGIGDNMSADVHIDMKDRVINFNPSAYTNHGVHIAGIQGGAGIMDVKGEGVAPASRMICHSFSRIWENTAVFKQMYNMTLTNNSYAAVIRDCGYSGLYNVYSESIDKLALQYKDVLHVFASGNDGNMDCNPFPHGYATVVGGYQPAKNNIVVASTDKDYVNAFDAGRGPVKDGRLKPEITAVGVNVRSCTKNEDYLIASGTSMATPGVTGGLALLSERYKQLHSNANPASDLLKGLLLNSATDIGNPGPDYKFGFGFMNLDHALQTMELNRYVTGNIAQDGLRNYSITVPANVAKLKVMLYYHDLPANPMSASQLVNDLDIEVGDPSSVLHKPLILNPDPARVLDNATEGVDRLNNCEQVTIDNPASGTYTVTVKGHKIPTGTQDFVVVYSFENAGVTLAFPNTASQVMAGDTIHVYWDSQNNTDKFALSYSVNGGSFTDIDTNIIGSTRYYSWAVPANISNKCSLRIRQGADQHVINDFVINPRPNLYPDSGQCPGYIRINWDAIPNASAYEVMRKVGAKLEVVATTSNLTYTFSGLSLDSVYYVAVRPVINGLKGFRSYAVKRKPNDGNCAGSISDGDLMLEKILSPATGRKFTSTELSNTSNISFVIKNIDDAPATAYKIWYNVNNTGWLQQSFTNIIPANGSAVIILTGFDFSAVGSYNIRLAVENIAMADPVKVNDSAFRTFRQVNNPTLNLSLAVTDNFEDWPETIKTEDAIALSPNDRWDYFNQSDTCRLRSFITPDICVAGGRSISLDAVYNNRQSNKNEFRTTYNIANYNKNVDEVRLEFDYLLHGQPRNEDSNYVSVRGKDTDQWKRLYYFTSDAGGTGKVINSGSLSLTDLMLDSNQSFSTSTQVDFVQNDISLISERNYGNGMTLDNVKLYTVFNDIQLLGIMSPQNIECGLGGEHTLKIKVRNGVNQILNDVSLFYQLDNGVVVKEVLGGIAGKQTIEYSFNKKLNLSVFGKHVLNVWLAANGDTYLKNDSILNYEVHNQPLVTNYPYYEDFEKSNGNWYTDGRSSSWEWGQPISPKINKAYSGSNVWKTNLNGEYNTSELSYLYSPCFDLTGLINPAIRFKKAIDIENCGQVLCDGAVMDYSTNRSVWLRLGKAGEGTAWYNDTTYTMWSEENHTAWHYTYLPLPKGLKTVAFRFTFFSDMGAEKEGLAIDDVEIFEDLTLLESSNLLSLSPNPTKDGKITIEWTAQAGDDFKLSMFNTMGKEVYSAETVSKARYNKTQIETPHFSGGVYVVNVIIGKRKYTRKIVYLW